MQLPVCNNRPMPLICALRNHGGLRVASARPTVPSSVHHNPIARGCDGELR